MNSSDYYCAFCGFPSEKLWQLVSKDGVLINHASLNSRSHIDLSHLKSGTAQDNR